MLSLGWLTGCTLNPQHEHLTNSGSMRSAPKEDNTVGGINWARVVLGGFVSGVIKEAEKPCQILPKRRKSAQHPERPGD